MSLPEVFRSSYKVFQTLREAHQQNRLPHAIIFQGNEGGTALSLALHLARFIHCTGEKRLDACGTCASCHKHTQLIHPDLLLTLPVTGGDKVSSDDYVHEFRKAVLEQPYLDLSSWMALAFDDENKQGNINRAESRKIVSKLGMKPFESDTKIQLIWMAELLGDVGNSLLKVIEEPPHKTFFFLVTYKMERILPTVRSRCQNVLVPPTLPEETRNWLMAINPDAQGVDHIAYMVEGNLLAAQNLAHESEHDFTELVRNWMLACYGLQYHEIVNWVNETGKFKREQRKQLLIHALQIMRESLQLTIRPDYVPRISAKHKEFVIKFSKTLDPQVIQLIYKVINEQVYFIERNANARISLFNLSLEIKNIFRQKRLAS